MKKIEQNNNQKKEMLGIYVSPELVEKVEDMIFHVKKQLPREKRKKFSRSLFLNLILESMVSEYETSQLNSPIQKMLADWCSTE